MEVTFEKHCANDALELYALGRLEETAAEELEDHLFLCEPCRTRLDETEIFVRSMRSAAARLRLEEGSETKARFARWFALPVWGTAAACACVLAVSVVWIGRPGITGAPVSVSLRAERGTSQTVPAHHPLAVSLDVRGLNLRKSAHVVLVNADGAALEQADAVGDGKVQARFSKPLGQGDYFVRIYQPGDRDPVREFAIRAE